MTLECGGQAVGINIVDESDERGGVATRDQPADERSALAVKDPLPPGISRIVLQREQIGAGERAALPLGEPEIILLGGSQWGTSTATDHLSSTGYMSPRDNCNPKQ